jgi:hypothetical protein
MENIPSDIDFAGKLPKANEDFDQRKERSMEALACSVSHAGVIKFWALTPIPWKHTRCGGMVVPFTVFGQSIIPRCPRQQVTKTITS